MTYVSEIIMVHTLNVYSAVVNHISIKLEGIKDVRDKGPCPSRTPVPE